MNLSFSTRGWGDLGWEELLDAALDMKFTGIEVYNLFKFPNLTDRGGPFHCHKIAATVRQLRDLKLSIPCLDTSLDLSLSCENADTLTAMLRIARDLADMPTEERKLLPGLQPNRADIIVHGVCILLACMRTLGIDRIAVSEYGNLDGYMKRRYAAG